MTQPSERPDFWKQVDEAIRETHDLLATDGGPVTPSDRPVTDEELAEWDVLFRGDGTGRGEISRQLIAAVREARAKHDACFQELEDTRAKLAEIRAVVKEYERHGDLDPQYMVIREVKAVFGE